MTQERRAGLARLMLRLPTEREHLKAYCYGSSAAGGMCIAYALACRAADYWSSSNAPKATELAEEYGLLIRELEVEIFEAMQVPPGKT